MTSPPGRPDLADADDVAGLVRAFYDRALVDPLLGPVFAATVGDALEAHLPRISAFWQRVLLGTGSYGGRPTAVHQAVHAAVPLTRAHFERWLALWQAAVDERHAGPVADAAVRHAEHMAEGLLGALQRRELPLV